MFRKEPEMDKKACILIVDDNQDVLQSFTMVLELNGYVVETARDGLYALDKCAEKQYDAVLMDICMPRLNGAEAFRRLKITHPELRIILMSAYSDEQENEKLLREGLFKAIGKPMKISYLLNVIREATASPRVIIVDDDTSIGGTLAQILRLRGYDSCVASSGRDAVKLIIARKNDIEIALIDIKMPDMDGFATLARLKEIKPELTTVLMTAYQDEMKDKISVAARELQTDCLFKPFEPAEVIERARERKEA